MMKTIIIILIGTISVLDLIENQPISSSLSEFVYDLWYDPFCTRSDCNGILFKDKENDIGECLADFPPKSGNYWCYVNEESLCPKMPSSICDGCFYSFTSCQKKILYI